MILLFLFLASIFSPNQVIGQITSDPVLMAETNKIKVIDQHAHPLVAVNENQKDTGRDELSLEITGEGEIERDLLPYRLSPASRELINVWLALS